MEEAAMKLAACVVLVASSAVATAQVPRRTVGLVEYVQRSYGGIKADLVKAAEEMPEAAYGFKPTTMNAARTYGAVIAHATDGMFAGCAAVRAVPNPSPDVEKTLTAKSDIVNALAASMAFCDEAFSGLTDQNAADPVHQGPVDITRAAALMGVLAHNAEMWGISTVYLRAQNIVPPGSDR
jgi:hypothetical protein